MINIVLSAYNGERYISDQIRSILELGRSDLKLFVFDDVSSDDTVRIVSGFEKEYPETVKLVENKFNKGFARNFLEGLRYTAVNSPADYYVFCDQDDVWLENRITVCLKRMEELEEKYSKDMPVLLFTDAVMADKDLNRMGTTFFKADRLNTSDIRFPGLLMENRCIGCTSFMNAALVRIIAESLKNGFDKRIRYHDWWAALTASAFGRIEFIDVPTILYRQHGNNEVGQTSFYGYIKDRIAGIEENRTRIRKTIAQGSAFYRAYAERLRRAEKRTIREFIALGWADPLEKRRLILKNGFYKSGFIRNIGLLMIV